MIGNNMTPKTVRRSRILIGIVLMLVGVLIAFLIIKVQYDDCAYRWINDLDAFGRKYASVWDCFITRSKGCMMIAVVIGSIPFMAGCHMLQREKNHHDYIARDQ